MALLSQSYENGWLGLKSDQHQASTWAHKARHAKE
jgi:hypothetical protein